MQNQVDLSLPVAKTIEQHPELLELLIDLGFTPLSNPVMRNTVGQVTTLKAGAKMVGVPLEKIVSALENNGYDVIGVADGK
ncbi:DUF1858 domain-containing protein [Streptococcus merionis]|uniref:Domain of uncharacterized function (DUF1858) n=1 Tax=Streptococcus merionis TaxID=400065 RepID=A0A239SVZ6_9STRE|nr:DUF1858 domain-containing protein [Streptococcus merionis]SNU89675.1 Domain of uncharacterised function (DUF1858) [Streptococcus merionis]